MNEQAIYKRKESDEWFIARLVGVGYTREEAIAMLESDLEDAAEEDGYDGP
jgi:hypothetical protein